MNLEARFNVCSLALSYEEIGRDIYPPMKRELTRQGIKFDSHHARIINQNDYDHADYIFYMDNSNKRILDYMFKDDNYLEGQTLSVYDKDQAFYQGNSWDTIRQNYDEMPIANESDPTNK